jgi:hypothetical protein
MTRDVRPTSRPAERDATRVSWHLQRSASKPRRTWLNPGGRIEPILNSTGSKTSPAVGPVRYASLATRATRDGRTIRSPPPARDANTFDPLLLTKVFYVPSQCDGRTRHRRQVEAALTGWPANRRGACAPDLRLQWPARLKVRESLSKGSRPCNPSFLRTLPSCRAMVK